MTYIVTINQTDADHIETVKAEMLTRGAPVIRCIRDEAQGIIVALEGSHRIAAAIELGIAPILKMLSDDDMLTCEEIEYDDCGWFDGLPARAADIRDHIGRPNGTYRGCAFHTLDDFEEA